MKLLNIIKNFLFDLRGFYKAVFKYRGNEQTIFLQRPFMFIDGVPVCCNTEVLMYYGATSRVPYAISLVYRNEKFVFINDAMYKRESEFRDAMIVHEIGHLRIHDTQYGKTKLSKDTLHQEDIEADNYVVASGYDVVYMLEELKKLNFPVDQRLEHFTQCRC